jgi:hypothetical protein
VRRSEVNGTRLIVEDDSMLGAGAVVIEELLNRDRLLHHHSLYTEFMYEKNKSKNRLVIMTKVLKIKELH